ncbi:MAG: GerMN domain-containing protein, partial [bacterium]
VSRNINKSTGRKLSAMDALLKGPTQEERRKGYYSQLPLRLELKNMKMDKKTAILDFSKELKYYGGGISKIQAIIAQIVYTATDLPDIGNVKILIEGKEVNALGSEGYMLDRELNRKNLSF